ncbi:MAG: efflux RND transporter permease subunit [Elusimicrobiota bacterium]
MRSIVRLCIERPLGVLAIYTGLAVLGIFSWFGMPQELLPDLRFPQLSVVTSLPNASPEEVENLVSKPLEQALGTVKNLRRVESSSRDHVSFVSLEFKWDTDMDAALLWVQEKLGLAQDQLPLEAGKPAVLRYNPFERPVVLLSVTGTLPLADLGHLVETRLKPRLEKVPGVSALEVTGNLEREIHVDLDAQKLAAHRLSILEVADALRRRNVSRSAGTAAEGLFEYPVTVSGSIADVAGLREAVVRSEASSPGGASGRTILRLGNMGTVADGFRERASHARYDGRDNISVAVYKRADAYPVEVSRNVREAVEELRRQLPAQIRIRPVYDQSRYIKEGITDVLGNVAAGGLLAFGVLWAFLKSRRQAAIVGVTIPLALLLTIAVLSRLGMTLNLLTLGGLALGVGMLVDSAVVIMENVSRHLASGKSLRDSVLDGATEVGGPVVYSVLTTVAAFAPIPFAAVGVAQRIFSPICAAVVISQFASLAVGLTAVPALAVLFMRREERAEKLDLSGLPKAAAARLEAWLKKGARALERLVALYEKNLGLALQRPRRVLAWTAAVTALNGSLLFLLPRQTMPDVDQDQFLVKMTLPAGTRLETTDQAVRRVEEALAAMPEVAHRTAVAGSPLRESPGALGPHQAEIVVDLAEKVKKPGAWLARRRRPAKALMREAAGRIAKLDLEGARVEYSAQGADVFSQVFGKAGADAVVEVKGQDFANLKAVAAELEEKLRAVPGVARVTGGLAAPSLQVRYEMDELKLAHDGLSVAEAAEAVLAGIHGAVPTKLREKGREIDIRVRLEPEDRRDAAALSALVLASPVDRVGHPLAEYGKLELAPGPSEIRRRNQARTLLLSVHLSDRRPDEALEDVEKILADYRRRPDASAGMSGEAEERRASLRSLLYGFAASLALVYIVLVAQFNALWVPLLALVAVPLSLNGAVPGLLLTGNTLNLMSGQGLMILGGIVVNNSLMLLEFVQQRRLEGLSPVQAAEEASRLRARPILMTVVGNAAGLLPLSLGIGRGAEMQSPMAVTVIFGLLVSTALTLVVLPALYLEARRMFEKD